MPIASIGFGIAHQHHPRGHCPQRVRSSTAPRTASGWRASRCALACRRWIAGPSAIGSEKGYAEPDDVGARLHQRVHERNGELDARVAVMNGMRASRRLAGGDRSSRNARHAHREGRVLRDLMHILVAVPPEEDRRAAPAPAHSGRDLHGMRQRVAHRVPARPPWCGSACGRRAALPRPVVATHARVRCPSATNARRHRTARLEIELRLDDLPVLILQEQQVRLPWKTLVPRIACGWIVAAMPSPASTPDGCTAASWIYGENAPMALSAASHTREDRVGLPADHLRHRDAQRLVTESKLTHHHRIGAWAGDGADDVVGVGCWSPSRPSLR